MDDAKGKRRDRQLRLWYPGPRGDALKGASLWSKIRHIGYRLINAETGFLNILDQWFESKLGSHHYTLHTVVGYPYAYRELPKKRSSRVLVVGGAHSAFAYTLASLGYDTHVVDLKPYALSHSNLTVWEGNAQSLPFQSDTFDFSVANFVVGCISKPSSDDKFPEKPTIEELSRVTTSEGKAVVSSACAKDPGFLPARVYTPDLFNELVSDSFEIQHRELFARTAETWEPCDKKSLPSREGKRTSTGVISATMTPL